MHISPTLGQGFRRTWTKLRWHVDTVTPTLGQHYGPCGHLVGLDNLSTL